MCLIRSHPPLSVVSISSSKSNITFRSFAPFFVLSYWFSSIHLKTVWHHYHYSVVVTFANFFPATGSTISVVLHFVQKYITKLNMKWQRAKSGFLIGTDFSTGKDNAKTSAMAKGERIGSFKPYHHRSYLYSGQKVAQLSTKLIGWYFLKEISHHPINIKKPN